MIEFKGYISGSAKKFFLKKTRMLVQNLFLFSLIMCFPVILYYIAITQLWMFMPGYLSLFIITPILVRIPQTKKSIQKITPKRIYIKDECIICEADSFVERRYIEDAKKLRDHGDFYEICFPMGRYSEKFICQKDLLSKGSLEEFELLFRDKITKSKDNQGTVL